MPRAKAVADKADIDGEGWLSVREASDRAGVSVSAIRKWYNSDVVASKMIEGPHGLQRMVRFDDVVARRDAWDGRPFPEHRLPEGMLPVPMAEWQRILEVVAGGMSGFHDLATQLAEARADAAAAQTKVGFLEERLAEMRAELVIAQTEGTQPRRHWFRRAGPPES